jgi:hypothetical protein
MLMDSPEYRTFDTVAQINALPLAYLKKLLYRPHMKLDLTRYSEPSLSHSTISSL